RAGHGLRGAPEAAALRRLPRRAGADPPAERGVRAAAHRRGGGRIMSAPRIVYNEGYLDEQTKRVVRRALLKGVAIPGFQVPFASREVPMPRGWGTGGVQVTAAVLGADDTLKVIDQGADDTTNAVSIRQFFEKVAGSSRSEE